MVLSAFLALTLAGGTIGQDPLLSGGRGYCLATGYCTSGPGESGRPTGPMFLAIGLVGAGLAALRRDQRARPRRT
ncbi:MAG TPA: hypothetical protein VE091_10630 [Gemmatimonadales bacterium]|nr:hypothetical protein [Gemmatimonadales bacterium]